MTGELDSMHTTGNLNWDPASVDMPEIAMLPPGEDAMSMTISGVLPTLTAPMAASVAALRAKETMFSNKVDSAQSAYQNSDDQGGQSVGQLGQTLGQFGQMAQQAGGPAQQGGQQAGQFGSMIQQAMQSAEGGSGSHDAFDAWQDQRSEHGDRDAREKEAREGGAPPDSATPGAAPHGAGPAPVAPECQAGGDDLVPRM